MNGKTYLEGQFKPSKEPPMTTLRQTPTLAGWISSFAALLKPDYRASDIAAAVARSGNPAGA